MWGESWVWGFETGFPEKPRPHFQGVQLGQIPKVARVGRHSDPGEGQQGKSLAFSDPFLGAGIWLSIFFRDPRFLEWVQGERQEFQVISPLITISSR